MTDRQAKRRGFLTTGREIVKRETPLGLYKGLGAVVTGIVPKMAIRFSSYETYKDLMADPTTGTVSGRATFLGPPAPSSANLLTLTSLPTAGLAAGVTEAVLVVNPMEVTKIRLQAQHHSMADPLDVPKYRNAAHAAYTVVREEGFPALYRGVVLTALRQGSNQAVNFTAYTYLKQLLQRAQSSPPSSSSPSPSSPHGPPDLPAHQTMAIGLVSGALGPLANAPIDTLKTRLQTAAATPGESAFARVRRLATETLRREGVRAFYKGLTPRVMRVAPGQAVTFAVYEFLRERLERRGGEWVGGTFEE